MDDRPSGSSSCLSIAWLRFFGKGDVRGGFRVAAPPVRGGCLGSDRGFPWFNSGWMGRVSVPGCFHRPMRVLAQVATYGVGGLSAGCSAGPWFPGRGFRWLPSGFYFRDLGLVFAFSTFSKFRGARPPPRPPAHSLRGFFWKFKGFVFRGSQVGCACPGDVHRASGSAVSGAGRVQAFVGARLDSQPGLEHGGGRGFSCEGCLGSDRGFSRFYGGWVGLLVPGGVLPLMRVLAQVVANGVGAGWLVLRGVPLVGVSRPGFWRILG